MKKLISILTVTAMVCGLSACGSKDVVIYADEQTTTQKVEIPETIPPFFEDITEPSNEPVFQGPRLSDSCDKVLCKAQDGDDYYEMVANQSEDYSGVKTEIGVIKNNQWLQPLTSAHPFIDEENTMLGKYVNTIYDTFIVEYLGNGCFYYYGTDVYNYYDEAFYNAKNGKSYLLSSHRDPALIYCKYQTEKGSQYKTCLTGDNNGKIIFDAYGPYEHKSYEEKEGYYMWYKVLDLETMTVEEKKPDVVNPAVDIYFFPYSEGLFAVSNYAQILMFYDIDGNCVLDLSKYKLALNHQKFFFENGLCTFNIINSNDTEYKITIDKTGQVVNSEQV